VLLQGHGQAPGNLTGHTPGLQVVQKRAQFVGRFLRGDGQFAPVQRVQQRRGQFMHIHVPLAVLVVNPAFVPALFERMDS